MDAFRTLQEQALGALLNHAQIQQPAATAPSRRSGSFQRVLFTNERVRALSDAIDAGVLPLPDVDPPLNALEQQGKVVFTRACAQCHGGPGQSTAQAPVVRLHDISTQCPRPVDTGRVSPRASNSLRARRALRAMREPTRSRWPNGSHDPANQLGSRPRTADGIRRRPAAGRTTGTSSTSLACAVSPHRAVLPQQQRRHAGGSRRPLHRVLQQIRVVAPPGVVPPAASTDGVNFDRQPRPEERAALLAYLRKL